MKTNCRLSGARPLLALALLLTCLAPAWSDTVDKAAQKKTKAELDAFYKSLVLSPMTIDRTVVKNGEVLRPTVTLTNTSKVALVVPAMPGKSASNNQKAGVESWSLRSLDRKRKDEEPMHWGLIHWLQQIPAGQVIPLNYNSYIDPAKMNLESGDYELSVEFEGADGRIVGKRAARFKVENAARIDPAILAKQRKEEQAKRAAAGTKVYPFLQVGDIVLDTDTVKRGLPVTGRCALANTGQADLILPPEFQYDTDRGKARYNIGSEQWYCESSKGREAIRGSIILCGEAIAAGRPVELVTAMSTGDLEPGRYWLVVEISDAVGQKIGTRKQPFTVK